MGLFILVICLAVSCAAADPFTVRALAETDRLITCTYDRLQGVFVGEGLWQSGNTVETLANMIIAGKGPAAEWATILENTYERTPVIVDQCNDDHQWYLLAWIRAYEATGRKPYLVRAAEVFDYITANAWTPLCGGGVVWCPTGVSGRRDSPVNGTHFTLSTWAPRRVTLFFQFNF